MDTDDQAPAPQPASDPLRNLLDEAIADFADPDATHMTAPPSPRTAPTTFYQNGDRIGPYQLDQLLGAGGFGEVWAATQSEPIRREVALKLIKPGMDSQQIIVRFEAERQVLALMSHPSIAGVLDAGTTEAGRPYFVMELVHGQPISTYCDQHRLTIRQRIELLIPVCQAVQHAHQKGILHRDLKPANILIAEVDGKPVPKVIDFGIAKALDTSSEDALNASLLQTQEGAIIGTPQYMSPEQAGSTPDLDTRSDIYTLGIILYELLTGDTPLTTAGLRRVAMHEIIRQIREAEPLRPSSRVIPVTDHIRTTSTARQLDPSKLTRTLRGDLDWITLKALEKDRDRRYESANDFAQDLQRHLSNEPVTAGPPSAGYRLKKLVQRNRLAFAAAAVITVLLVAGIVGTSMGLIQARRAQAAEALRADGERRAKEQVETEKTRAVAAEHSASAEKERAVAAEGVAKKEADRAEAQQKAAESTAAAMAHQASSANLALAKERLESQAWADCLAYTAAALRAWPENPTAASSAADLLFDGRSFCADVWMPTKSETLVSVGYPFAISQNTEGRKASLRKFEKNEQSSYTWNSIPWIGGENNGLADLWQISPSGHFAVAVSGSKVTIIDLSNPTTSSNEVGLAVSSENRKISFSQNGDFLIVASDLMAEVIDLRSATKEWTISDRSGITSVGVSNDGKHAATATAPQHLISNAVLRILSKTGSCIDVNKLGDPVSMATSSKDGSIIVACTKGRFGKGDIKVLKRQKEGGYLTKKALNIEFDPLCMRVADDAKSLAIIAYENESRISMGRLDLSGSLHDIEWLNGAQAGPGLFWPMEIDCYGFAAQGEVAVLTAHSLEVSNRSSVFCFGLASGRMSSFSFGARVESVAPADDAAVVAICTTPLPVLDSEGNNVFLRSNVESRDLSELLNSTPDSSRTHPLAKEKRILDHVRVSLPCGCLALSQDGKRLALAGPFLEQVSIHEVDTGRVLGFLHLHASETMDPVKMGYKAGDKVNVTSDGPITIWDLSFVSNDKLSVVFRSHQGRTGIGTVELDKMTAPDAAWSALDRRGYGESTKVNASWLAPLDISSKGSERSALKGCTPAAGLAFFTERDSSFSSLSYVAWHDQAGGNGPLLQLEAGFIVNSIVLSGSAKTLLISGRPDNENYTKNTFDDKPKSGLLSTAFVIWQPGINLGIGISREFTEHSKLIRVEDGITSSAFSPDEHRFVIGQSNGAVRSWLLPSGVPNKLTELAASIPAVGSAATSLNIISDGTAVCARYADGHFRLWNLGSSAAFAQISADSISHKPSTVEPKHPVPPTALLPTDGEPAPWPSNSVPPSWVPDFLEACAGKTVASIQGSWGLNSLMLAEIADRKNRVAQAESMHNSWSQWTSWIRLSSPQRSAYPGLTTGETIFPLRAAFPTFKSDSKNIHFPALSVLGLRPYHWMLPFILADEEARIAQEIPDEVHKLFSEGLRRIDQCLEKERPICWAMAAAASSNLPYQLRLQLTDRAVQRAPQSALVWFLRGFTLSDQQATEALHKASELEPVPLHYLWLARSETKSGDISNSEKHYRLALKGDLARNEEAQLEFAACLLALGKTEEAQSRLKALWTLERSKSDIDNDILPHLICVALWRNGKKEEAIKIYIEKFGTSSSPTKLYQNSVLQVAQLDLTLADIHSVIISATSKSPIKN